MKLTLGRPSRAEAAVDEPEQHARVREARLKAARTNPRWTEIAEAVLVRRGPFLVHADTDDLYLPYRGTVWSGGTASPISDRSQLFFTVDTAGGMAFLEKSMNPSTWAQVVAKQARRAAKAARP